MWYRYGTRKTRPIKSRRWKKICSTARTDAEGHQPGILRCLKFLEFQKSQVSISHLSTTGCIRPDVEVPELSFGHNPRLPSASSGIDLQFIIIITIVIVVITIITITITIIRWDRPSILSRTRSLLHRHEGSWARRRHPPGRAFCGGA